MMPQEQPPFVERKPLLELNTKRALPRTEEPHKRMKAAEPADDVGFDELLGRPSQQVGTQRGQRGDTPGFSTILRPPTAQQQHTMPGSTAGKANGGAAGLTTFGDIACQVNPVGAHTNQEGMNTAKLRLLNASFSAGGPQTAAAAATPSATHVQQQPALPSTTAAAAVPQPHEFNVQGEHQCVPYDWALKRLWRLSSPLRFSAVDGSGSGGRGCGIEHRDWDTLNYKEKWNRALLSWRYPASPWDADAIAALSLGRPGAGKALAQRLDAWREAFSSAYLAVRHGQSSGLYVLYPEVPRASSTSAFTPTSASSTSEAACSTVILFTPGGTRSNTQPQAMVSQSTHVLRSKLAAGGLRFTMPLARQPLHPQGSTTYVNAEQDDLDLRPAGENGHPASKQQQGGVQGGVGVAKDGTPASMLLFSGVQEVHGLADYLLETQGFRGLHQGGFSEGSMDVPVLLAPVHFDGASIHRPLVKSLGSMATPHVTLLPPTTSGTLKGLEPSSSSCSSHALEQQQQQQQQQALQSTSAGTNSAHGNGLNSGSSCHVVEVAGPLPPWSLTRLCAVMQANQQPFQADLASYSACITLNCCPTTQQAEVYRGGQCANDARHLSALVVHESSALQHMQPQLKNKVMRSVRYESEQQCGGVFVVRTNS